MNLSIDDVMSRRKADRYQLLHQAILGVKRDEGTPFHPTKECIVCGEEFIFPENWNFTRIKGEVSCNEHFIGEVMEKIGAVNAIKG